MIYLMKNVVSFMLEMLLSNWKELDFKNVGGLMEYARSVEIK